MRGMEDTSIRVVWNQVAIRTAFTSFESGLTSSINEENISLPHFIIAEDPLT
jgi:hypothetical protein